MRQGTVLYLANAMEIGEDFDDGRAIADLDLDPERTMLASSIPGYYEIHDAVRLMILRGFKRIEGLRAAVHPDQSVRPIGKPFRLFG